MYLRRYLHYETIDSTSAFIKRRRLTLRNFTFVSSDFQTNGRGRTGRTWNSEKNENLMFSVLVKDKALVQKFPILSVCSALAVLNVLKRSGFTDVFVKWPNDVYVSGKKICGILLEGITVKGKLKNVVIGVGLNVNQTVFGEVLHTATSMKLEQGIPFDVLSVKKAVYAEFNAMFKSLKVSNAYMNGVFENDYLKGQTVFAEIGGEKREVSVIGINSDATLKVRLDNGILDLSTGEITFHVN